MTAASSSRLRRANASAFAAIVLWASLAWLGVRLAAVPPYLLVGSALTVAGVLASPTWRSWRVPLRVLALGVYGLFGFHFLLFVALRLAPPLEANLVNYLWPLLMVLLAPHFLDGVRLARGHVVAAFLGLAGALLAITNGRWPGATGATDVAHPQAVLGYAAALGSAFIWASYSLWSQRLRLCGVAYPTAALGASCLVAGLLALGCHAVLEAPYRIGWTDAGPLAALAIGPMGGAFFLWDAALARGDARTIGTLAYLTPVLSTLLLAQGRAAPIGWPPLVALALVVGAAVVGARARERPPS